MNKTLRLVLIVIFAISLVSLLQMSCIFDGSAENEEDICPDSLVGVDEAILSSAVDAGGMPIDSTRVFTTDANEIYCSFWLSEDLCCKTLSVVWRYGNATIETWSDKSGITLFPLTVSVQKPDGGFLAGGYSVVIYIDIIEVMTIPFTVE
jgi:hypothetical protein